ncbi:MAG TPA: MFS transporter [Thermomicrobiales bacterium]
MAIASVLPTRRTPITSLTIAGIISLTGSMLTSVAIPWFVLQTTNSAAKTGLTGVFTTLPYIIGGVFGGTLVDRLGFKRASILADLTSGATIALIPLLYHTIGLAFWQLLALTFLANLFDTPGNTARQSLVPDLADLAGMRLERANALVQSIPRFAILFGPPLAGVLIALFGASDVLWLDAASFAISAVVIGTCIPRRARAAPHGGGVRQYFADLAEGWRFVAHHRMVRALITFFLFTNLLESPWSLLLAVYTKRVFGTAVSFGTVLASLGAGAIVSSFLFAAVGHRLPRLGVLALYPFGGAITFSALALNLPFIALVIVTFGYGLAVGMVNPLTNTIRQEQVPSALLGRVQGIVTARSFAFIPLGRGIAAVLIDPVGLPTLFLGIGLLFTLATIVMLVLPVFRDLSAPEEDRRVE